jgi:hypothetical protein
VEAAALAADGVKVIVLGIGPGLDGDPGGVPGCLDQLAEKGGFPHLEGTSWFFSGADPARLETALQQIFGGVSQPSCSLDLASAPTDPTQVAVFLDGQEIPRDGDQGWSYAPPDDSRHIVINGLYCSRIQRFEVGQIDVRVGCPPCTGPTCEAK